MYIHNCSCSNKSLITCSFSRLQKCYCLYSVEPPLFRNRPYSRHNQHTTKLLLLWWRKTNQDKKFEKMVSDKSGGRMISFSSLSSRDVIPVSCRCKITDKLPPRLTEFNTLLEEKLNGKELDS
ncbi:hypothetical protein AAHE18_07G101400 [Arachis hypogaea]